MAITGATRRVNQQWKDDLRALSDAQIVALTGAFVALWDELSPEYEQAILSIAADYPDGVTASQMAQDERIIQAMDTTRQRLDELVEQAGDRIALDLPEVVQAGSSAPLEMLRSQLPEGTVSVRFGAVNPEALTAIVARTTEQITSRTMPLSAEMEQAIRTQLTRGVVAGANPREVARSIMRDVEGEFNGGLSRAATVARTEMLDSSRAAHQVTVIENSDLIQSNVWQATLDARTCISCLEQHGQEFPKDEFGPLDHQNGRCTFIVKLVPWSQLGIDAEEPPDNTVDAREWFNGLTEDTQRRIMGPERYDKWQAGEVQWGEFSSRRSNENWRDAYYQRPVRDLP